MLGSLNEKSKSAIYLSNKDNSPVSQSCDFQLHLFVGILWRNLSSVQHKAIVLSNVLHGLGKVRFYWANRREFFQDFKQRSHLKEKTKLTWGFWQNKCSKSERKKNIWTTTGFQVFCAMLYNIIYPNSIRHNPLQHKRTAQLNRQQHNQTHV